MSRFAQVAVLSLAGLSMTGCGSLPKPALPDGIVTPEASGKLGVVGGHTFYIKSVDGTDFLVADRYESVGLVEHVPTDKVLYGRHNFQVVDKGTVGGHKIYTVTVDGTKYLFLDRYESCELKPFSK
jgi:hypothetical protein